MPARRPRYQGALLSWRLGRIPIIAPPNNLIERPSVAAIEGHAAVPGVNSRDA